MTASLLVALALLPDARAASIHDVRLRAEGAGQDTTYRAQVVTTDADGAVASVDASFDRQTLSLSETDAWVHGAAALSREPAVGAEVDLVAFDEKGNVIASFSGVYTGDALALVDTGALPADIAVRGVRVLADGTVAVDLNGADLLAITDLSLTSTEISEKCLAYDKTGACVKPERVLSQDVAPVLLGDVAVVWESEVAFYAVDTLTATARDARGKRLDKEKVDVARPWSDGGAGVNALPVDGDPLTQCALISDELHNGGTRPFVVVSSGWTIGDDLPELAEVTIDDGESWSVPVHSYQVTAQVALDALVLPTTVALNGVKLTQDDASSWSGAGVSVDVYTDDDGAMWAWINVGTDDGDALPTAAALLIDKNVYDATFDDDVLAVFGLETTLDGDADGLDLSGKIKLSGPADAKGKRATLVKGKFAGRFGADADGDVDLASVSRASAASAGALVVGGATLTFDPVAREKKPVKKDPPPPPPPEPGPSDHLDLALDVDVK